MNKKISVFSLAAAMAATVLASSIDWTMPYVLAGATEGESYTYGTTDGYTIEFLTGVTATTADDGSIVYTAGSNNGGLNKDVSVDTDYGAWGTWTDSNTTLPQTYYVAAKIGDTLYALTTNGTADNVLTVSYSGDGLGDINNPPSYSAFDASGLYETITDGGYKAATATQVPEPATAAMGLIGLALLMRRRKQA